MDYGIIGIMIILYAGIALILWAYFGFPKIRLKLPDEMQTYKRKKGYPILAWLVPFTGPFLRRARMDVGLKRRIDAAHVNFTPAEFFNLKLLLMGLLGMLGFILQGGGLLGLLLGMGSTAHHVGFPRQRPLATVPVFDRPLSKY